MMKTFLAASVLIASVFAVGATHLQQQAKQPDKSVHHAAMHAENWTKHHISAPHRKKPYHKKKNTVKHAVKHAANWVDHHVSAPHKTGGN